MVCSYSIPIYSQGRIESFFKKYKFKSLCQFLVFHPYTWIPIETLFIFRFKKIMHFMFYNNPLYSNGKKSYSYKQ